MTRIALRAKADVDYCYWALEKLSKRFDGPWIVALVDAATGKAHADAVKMKADIVTLLTRMIKGKQILREDTEYDEMMLAEVMTIEVVPASAIEAVSPEAPSEALRTMSEERDGVSRDAQNHYSKAGSQP